MKQVLIIIVTLVSLQAYGQTIKAKTTRRGEGVKIQSSHATIESAQPRETATDRYLKGNRTSSTNTPSATSSSSSEEVSILLSGEYML